MPPDPPRYGMLACVLRTKWPYILESAWQYDFSPLTFENVPTPLADVHCNTCAVIA